jgi:hypothetical protein
VREDSVARRIVQQAFQRMVKGNERHDVRLILNWHRDQQNVEKRSINLFSTLPRNDGYCTNKR